jgi:hypothetical protein
MEAERNVIADEMVRLEAASGRRGDQFPPRWRAHVRRDRDGPGDGSRETQYPSRGCPSWVAANKGCRKWSAFSSIFWIRRRARTDPPCASVLPKGLFPHAHVEVKARGLMIGSGVVGLSVQNAGRPKAQAKCHA